MIRTSSGAFSRNPTLISTCYLKLRLWTSASHVAFGYLEGISREYPNFPDVSDQVYCHRSNDSTYKPLGSSLSGLQAFMALSGPLFKA